MSNKVLADLGSVGHVTCQYEKVLADLGSVGRLYNNVVLLWMVTEQDEPLYKCYRDTKPAPAASQATKIYHNYLSYNFTYNTH